MRNYKSVGFNYTYILLYLTVIGIIYESNGDSSFAYEQYVLSHSFFTYDNYNFY